MKSRSLLPVFVLAAVPAAADPVLECNTGRRARSRSPTASPRPRRASMPPSRRRSASPWPPPPISTRSPAARSRFPRSRRRRRPGRPTATRNAPSWGELRRRSGTGIAIRSCRWSWAGRGSRSCCSTRGRPAQASAMTPRRIRRNRTSTIAMRILAPVSASARQPPEAEERRDGRDDEQDENQFEHGKSPVVSRPCRPRGQRGDRRGGSSLSREGAPRAGRPRSGLAARSTVGTIAFVKGRSTVPLSGRAGAAPAGPPRRG
jgi:hypothetical protein